MNSNTEIVRLKVPKPILASIAMSEQDSTKTASASHHEAEPRFRDIPCIGCVVLLTKWVPEDDDVRFWCIDAQDQG